MKKIIILVFVCALVLVACNDNTETEQSSGGVKDAVRTQSRFKGATLEAFFDEMFVSYMSSDPQDLEYFGDLTEFGVMPQSNLLTINSLEYQSDMKTYFEDALIHLESFGVESKDESYINYLNVKWFIEMELEKLEYGKHEFLLTHMFGEHQELYSLLNEFHIIESEQDAEDWIDRVIMSEEKIKDMIERYNSNAEEGYIMGPVSIDYTVSQVRKMIPRRIEFLDMNNNFQEQVNDLGLSEEKTLALHERAIDAIETYFTPNMKDLKDVLLASKSLSETSEGVWKLPNGDDYYIHTLKRRTTTSMSPEEIHDLGLSEVNRIQDEMEKAFKEIGYEGSLNEMINSLYDNSETYSGQAAMDRYVEVASEMEEQLSLFFYEEDLPATSANIVKSPGGNYYRRPSFDGKRNGAYYLDLSYTHYDFAINTLAYHETVPGHHFQMEHQLLIDSTPMIGKVSYNSAYVEGWALYAELLADENGFNDTPEHKIGYLKSELHRAARLVVDTGIHYKQWDRQQAVDYLVNEALLSSSYAKDEVARYMSWPGQACSYKIGQLKLLELRTLMEDSLGDVYDIKEFHHLVLANGILPLDILEEYILDYIENNK